MKNSHTCQGQPRAFCKIVRLLVLKKYPNGKKFSSPPPSSYLVKAILKIAGKKRAKSILIHLLRGTLKQVLKILKDQQILHENFQKQDLFEAQAKLRQEIIGEWTKSGNSKPNSWKIHESQAKKLEGLDKLYLLICHKINCEKLLWDIEEDQGKKRRQNLEQKLAYIKENQCCTYKFGEIQAIESYNSQIPTTAFTPPLSYQNDLMKQEYEYQQRQSINQNNGQICSTQDQVSLMNLWAFNDLDHSFECPFDWTNINSDDESISQVNEFDKND